jgi:hypothetical protein
MRYQPYEYDPDQTLELPTGPKVAVKHVSYGAMARVLPFCPYNGRYDHRLDDRIDGVVDAVVDDDEQQQSPPPSPSISLERRLVRSGILQTPPADPEFAGRIQDLTTDQLEVQLWIAIQQHLLISRRPISPTLLTLLPPPLPPQQQNSNDDEVTKGGTSLWPDDFVLYRVAAALQNNNNETNSTTAAVGMIGGVATVPDHTYVALSRRYPASRRQRRLSFSAAYLLETGDEPDRAQRARAELLAIPSTRQRLRVVLERFHQWQASHDVGAFE